MTLAADLARALDPVVLADKVGLAPEEWQEHALRSQAQRMILNCSRQSGKSTIAALIAVHTAIYQPSSLVLLLSPAERQSKELFRKCLSAYRTLGRPIASETENVLSLALENGSRIIALPGQEATVRGFSGVRLLVVDEAARVPDELYFAVRPMLAVSGGRLVLLSTPFGKRGFFYEAWTSREEWERYEVSARDCPRISDAFLEEEERTLGEWWFKQEYLCEFQDAESQAFRTEDVMAAINPGLETWKL